MTNSLAKDQDITPSTNLRTETKESLGSMTPEELYFKYLKLQEELRIQTVRTKIAETMIDVAEEEFGIAIRKNLLPSSAKAP